MEEEKDDSASRQIVVAILGFVVDDIRLHFDNSDAKVQSIIDRIQDLSTGVEKKLRSTGLLH
ncbi:hypothetical protein [Sulfuriferula sp.]|uniref:hypothetical protein n=1 Tax=Sulfuriferula sp. TaxID=2025307 RepID=UPI0027313FBE|nr:hypothetical protein [Sulfuriferula sp.]MDP2027883.1 hypothetical protein [Sulfuriferula sp.]